MVIVWQTKQIKKQGVMSWATDYIYVGRELNFTTSLIIVDTETVSQRKERRMVMITMVI